MKTPDFPAWVVAALLNTELPTADELAEQLVEAQVLEVAERAGSAIATGSTTFCASLPESALRTRSR